MVRRPNRSRTDNQKKKMRILYVSLKPKLNSLIEKGELTEIQLVVNQLWTKRLIEDDGLVNYEVVVISQSHSSESQRVAYHIKSIYTDKRMTRYEPKRMEPHFIIELGNKYVGGFESYEKVCSTCHRLLPASEFFYNVNTSDNCSCSCKECYAADQLSKRKDKGLYDLGDDNILDLPNEQWRPVVGYDGLYEVSNLGRVKSLPRYSFRNNGIVQRIYGRLIHLTKDSHTGYYRVALSKDGSQKFVGVHRLVAQAFIPNPNNLPIINHIDWDRTNNVVILDKDGNVIKSNLEWCTQKHNANHINTDEWIRRKRMKPIRQLDLSGNVIAVFKSAAEAERQTGINRKVIYAAIYNNFKKTKHPYKWERI